MKWLGIDTSDRYLFVCLCEDDKVLSKVSYEAWQRQSEYLDFIKYKERIQNAVEHAPYTDAHHGIHGGTL